MSRLKKPVLGELNGRAGNIVGRHFGNDHYISVRPKKYNVKKKLNAVSSKQRFYTVVKLAKTIVRYPELKESWDKCKMPGKRGYTRIIKENYKFLKDNLPTTENIITPKGRELIIDMVEVNDKGIRFSYDMAGLIKPRFCLTLFIVFFNPKNKGCGLNDIWEKREYIEVEYADRAKDKKGEKYLYNYGIDDQIILNRQNFRNAILYAAAAETSTFNNKKWWTSTAAIEISSFKLKYLFLSKDKYLPQNKSRKKISILQSSNSKKYKKAGG